MQEVWEPVKGYEGLYEVSNLGRVKSLYMFRHNINENKLEKIRRDKILSQRIHKTGYMITSLSKNKKRKDFYTHRLVANAFIPNPEKKTYINHIDENKTNNKVENLNWCTQKENVRFSTRTKKIEQLTIDGKHIKTWNNLYEIKDVLGYKKSHINQCCKGTREKSCGYKWRYVNE